MDKHDFPSNSLQMSPLHGSKVLSLPGMAGGCGGSALPSGCSGTHGWEIPSFTPPPDRGNRRVPGQGCGVELGDMHTWASLRVPGGTGEPPHHTGVPVPCSPPRPVPGCCIPCRGTTFHARALQATTAALPDQRSDSPEGTPRPSWGTRRDAGTAPVQQAEKCSRHCRRPPSPCSTWRELGRRVHLPANLL